MKSLVLLSFVLVFSSLLWRQTSSFARKLSVEMNAFYYWISEGTANLNDNFGLNKVKTFGELIFIPAFSISITDRFFLDCAPISSAPEVILLPFLPVGIT